MLVSLSYALSKLNSNIQIVCIVPNIRKLPATFAPIDFVEHHRRIKGDIHFRNLYHQFTSDLILWGGGSTFSDITKERISGLQHKAVIAKIAYLLNQPMIITGASIGPITTKTGKNLTEYVLKNCDLVQIRDARSAETCESFGMDTPISKGYDPAILLPKLYNIESKKSSSAKNKVVIGIAPAASDGFKSRNVPMLNQRLASGLERISRHRRIEIKIIQMCNHPAVSDYDRCTELMQICSQFCSSELIEYTSDLKYLLEAFSTFDLLIGERLHALVYAFALKIPFIAIPYHQKCLDFSKDVGLPVSQIWETVPSPQNIENFVDAFMRGAEFETATLDVDKVQATVEEKQAELIEQIHRTLSIDRKP